jgi:hypothetical protein
VFDGMLRLHALASAAIRQAQALRLQGIYPNPYVLPEGTHLFQARLATAPHRGRSFRSRASRGALRLFFTGRSVPTPPHVGAYDSWWRRLFLSVTIRFIRGCFFLPGAVGNRAPPGEVVSFSGFARGSAAVPRGTLRSNASSRRRLRFVVASAFLVRAEARGEIVGDGEPAETTFTEDFAYEGNLIAAEFLR